MVGRCVNHGWSIDVDSHGYGWLGGGSGMEVGVGMHVGQSQVGLFACQEMPEHFVSAR